MDRRRFLLTSLAGAVAVPLTAGAQQVGKVPRIGLLFDDAVSSEPLRQGLRALGYVEGQSILLEERAGSEGTDRWPALVAELVRIQVDVIVTRSTPATLAAKRATATIPIVMAGAGDPVRTGLVASLAHPGGNVTGVAFIGPGLAAKRLELLKEAIRHPMRVALIWNPSNPVQSAYFNEAKAGARSLGVTLLSVELRSGQALDDAFTAIRRARPSALLVTGDPVVQRHIDKLLGFAAKNQLPAMYNAAENVVAGGLMSYGPSRSEIARRAAIYVDKILKGTRPGDLPVEEPTTYEFAVNLKTSKALGLTIPPSLLARADQVVQ